jgi:hypothetical protein
LADRGYPRGVIPGDTIKLIIMWTVNYKILFLLHHLRIRIKGWLLRLGCHFFSSWSYIESDNICTIGNVLKLNKLYTYQENDLVDIVRLTDVHIERGFLYCSLFFTSKNKIITARQIMQKWTHVLWRIMDNEEFDKIMSRKLWKEVDKMDELLEFDYYSRYMKINIVL